MSDRIWDGRGDALDDARLTVADGRVADDLRLGLTHCRIMLHVGRQNGRRGWLRVSQVELADRWRLHRNTVNKAFRELVEWGWLLQRSQQEAGESFCLYKVLLGDNDAGTEPKAGAKPVDGECTLKGAPQGECPSTSAPGSAAPEVHSCTVGECTCAHLESAPPYIDTDKPINAEKKNPNPNGARAVGAKGEKSGRQSATDAAKLLASLRGDGVALPVVEHLLRPILEGKRFSSADRLERLRALRDSAKGIPTPALDKAAELVLRLDFQTIKPERIAEAIEAVRKAGAMVGIRVGSAQWAAWVKYFEAENPREAEVMRKVGVWQVRAPWPPGHKPASYEVRQREEMA